MSDKESSTIIFFLNLFVCSFVHSFYYLLCVYIPVPPNRLSKRLTPSDTHATLTQYKYILFKHMYYYYTIKCCTLCIVAKSLTVFQLFDVKPNHHTRLHDQIVCVCANSIATEISKGQHSTSIIPYICTEHKISQ